ncbi:MAG: polysaccharide biosynthesis protein [Bacteroidales bacterium]|jgi:FlaA1/EpsC-like NDP-sugar epimerase|nr:polysaccharide biosynthesis protein [Bacteroidales bacterium]
MQVRHGQNELKDVTLQIGIKHNKMNRLYHNMLHLIDKVMSRHYIPAWLIAIIDALIVILAIFVSGTIIGMKETWFHFPFDLYSARFILLTIVVTCSVLGIMKVHRSIIRYSTFSDMIRIMFALFLSDIVLLLINEGFKQFISSSQTDFFPKQLVIINFFVTYILLVLFRMFVRWLFEKAYKSGINTDLNTQVLIFGAGRTATATANTLMSASRKYYIKGFVDDDPNLAGKTIMGYRIWSAQRLEYLLKSTDIDSVIIATNRISIKRKNEIFDICNQNRIRVLLVPNIRTWNDGKLQENQIKEIQIEDLLGRKEIKPNQSLIEQALGSKTILVTGAAGSIGSEIVRQLVLYNPVIVLLDQAETPLYDIENELNDKHPQIHKHVVIGSITDKPHLESVFSVYHPDIVFHAAAYKHVPMMETSPYEAASVNIIGTKNVADLSVKYGSEKFIMISTDKAVNPTSVMGATKRYAEIYIQHLNCAESKTKFITTRFGNVLGSNGSVIPRFRQQISEGQPLTVTHPEITRYFMTIPEASRLVLEAATMGKGGEIFLFDMGEAVKIKTLAERMLKLSGLEAVEGKNIVYTGLRNGEKLYEELLTKKENTLPTYHKKIFIAQTEKISSQEVETSIANLISILSNQTSVAANQALIASNEDSIVANLKSLVRTFKSNNSRFEKLDPKEENE